MTDWHKGCESWRSGLVGESSSCINEGFFFLSFDEPKYLYYLKKTCFILLPGILQCASLSTHPFPQDPH